VWRLYDDKILFDGQPVAVVVAGTPEIARFAASLVKVAYEPRSYQQELASGATGPDDRRRATEN
jgi:CO/xanthine dehydrogenase Mo-binding subunit